MTILGAIPAKKCCFFGIKILLLQHRLIGEFVASLFTEVIFAKYAIVR